METALVLSAGGMYAAWEVGVWKALRERVQVEMVVGASAGAWNGWAIAGGCSVEELTEAWLDPALGAILRLGVHRGGLVRPEALYETARELFARYRPKIPFGLTLTEVPRLRPTLFRDGQIDWRHLAAACSIPVVFPPVRIDGKRYVDGGVLGALPLWAAAEMGARRAIGVNCLVSLPLRMVRCFLPRRRVTTRLEVTFIQPSAPLGSLHDAVHWSPENIRRWMELGERDGNRALASMALRS